MPHGVKIAHLTFASGATSTNTQFIGNTARVSLYVSTVTGWNAGAGNTTLQLLGSPVSGVACVPILSALISTETAGSIYQLDKGGAPFVSIQFGTATSGAGTISVMCFDDS